MSTAYKKQYPFTAIVGQEDMKLALLLNVIQPQIGGVLIRGEKGTAKSTAVRALTQLLPKINVVEGCRFKSHPTNTALMTNEVQKRFELGETLPVVETQMKVVTLPISATEDRVVGTIDMEAAIRDGKKTFEPGILADAHRNILYVDEVNLLDDHIVDLLLDAAAMGVNTVEREGISYSHPSRFVLVGTMNPEEGDLRPQLLDRFGLSIELKGITTPLERVEVVERRMAFDENPEAFIEQFHSQQEALQKKILDAQSILPEVVLSKEMKLVIASIAIEMDVDGHRADITMHKACIAIAALDGVKEVTLAHVKQAAAFVLPHRMRRKPFEQIGDEQQKIELAIAQALQAVRADGNE